MSWKNNWTDDVDTVHGTDLNDLADLVNGAYAKPGTGIPASDMASAVQTSLGLADSALQAAAQSTAINTQTDNYTLQISDRYNLVAMNKDTAVNVTFPQNVFSVGDSGEIGQWGVGQVTCVAGTGVASPLSSAIGTKTRARWSVIGWLCIATNTFLITGDAA